MYNLSLKVTTHYLLAMAAGELNQAHPKCWLVLWYLKLCSSDVISHPGSTCHSPSFVFLSSSSSPHPAPIHPFLSIPALPLPIPTLLSLPNLTPPCTPSLPALLNSADGRPRTLTVFSHATRRCWPLPMRKWFRTWTRTSSRDSPLSTQSSQELLLSPLLLSRLDFSSRTDTWTHSHKHRHIHTHTHTLNHFFLGIYTYTLKIISTKNITEAVQLMTLTDIHAHTLLFTPVQHGWCIGPFKSICRLRNNRRLSGDSWLCFSVLPSLYRLNQPR